MLPVGICSDDTTVFIVRIMIFIIGKTCAERASFPVVLGMGEDCYLRKRAYFFKNLFLMAAIINNSANEKWQIKAVRFGWIDFVDDIEVSTALLKAVEGRHEL